MKTNEDGTATVQAIHPWQDPQYTGFLNSLPEALALIDKDLRCRFINTMLAAWMGIKAGRMIGKSVSEVWGKDVQAQLKRLVEACDNGKHSHLKERIGTSFGQRYVEITCSQVRSSKGKKKKDGYILLLHDITPEKNIEKKHLKENQSLLEHFEHAAVAVHAIDDEGRIVWANQKALNLIGYTREEYVGHPVSEFHADCERITEILNRLQRKEPLDRCEAVLRCKDGSLRHVLISSDAQKLNEGRYHAWCYMVDVTDKEHSEKNLKEREEYYRRILENLPVGVYTCDENGRVRFFNRAATELWGSEPQPGKDLCCLPWRLKTLEGDLLPHDAYLLAAKAIKEEEPVWGSELVIERQDGTKRMVVPYAQPIRNEEGKVVGGVNIVVDITKQKEMELALKEEKEKRERNNRWLAESSSVGIYTCDKEGYLTFYNDTAAELWGQSPEMGKGVRFCGCPQIRNAQGEIIPLEESPIAKALDTGKSYRNVDMIFERPDGKKVYTSLNVHPLRDVENRTNGVIVIFQNIEERKRSAAGLPESHERYYRLLQSLPVAVYTCDERGHIQLFNQAALDMWGWKPEREEELYKGSWKVYTPKGLPLSPSQWPVRIALKENRPVNDREIILERPDGSRRNIIPAVQPLHDHSGKLTGAVNMLIDITGQRRAMHALYESQERFRMLSDQVPVIIWMTDVEGNCNYLNEQWQTLTGESPENGYGLRWLKRVHPEERAGVEQAWKEVFAGRGYFDRTFRFGTVKDGKTDWRILHATGSPWRDKEGRFSGYVGVLYDITLHEQTRSELLRQVKERTTALASRNEELRRFEESFHRMVDEIEDYSIVLLSREGTIENWNRGAEKINGYKGQEVIGKNFDILHTPEDRANHLPARLIDEAARKGRVSHEGLRMRKDGSTFWAYIVITALHDDNNSIIGFIKVTRDLTEIKAAEDQLKMTAIELEAKNNDLVKANQELASFAYVSSHDLQEPLRKIQTFSGRILEFEKDRLSEKATDYFNRIQNAASRMQALIQDLLAYSRTTSAERTFQLTDLNQLLLDVKSELREAIEEKNAVLEWSALPRLKVIPFQFHQLMTNIISNSLKFSKPKVVPYVTISASVVSRDEVPGTMPVDTGDKQYHHLMVADNGIGFDPAYSNKIFELFQRLHGRSEYRGTGIGLAICKKIVENHGGVIKARGELNKGATFHIFLPVREGEDIV